MAPIGSDRSVQNVEREFMQILSIFKDLVFFVQNRLFDSTTKRANRRGNGRTDFLRNSSSLVDVDFLKCLEEGRATVPVRLCESAECRRKFSADYGGYKNSKRSINQLKNSLVILKHEDVAILRKVSKIENRLHDLRLKN